MKNRTAHHVMGVGGMVVAILAAIGLANTGHGQPVLIEDGDKITNLSGASTDNLGFSVAIDGDVAVAGAWHEGISMASQNAGAAYVSRRSGGVWGTPVQLLARLPGGTLDRSANDAFGTSVAVSGNVIVVGSPKDNHLGTSSGSAYVYRYNSGSWDPEAKLVATVRAGGDNFGEAVAIDGNIVVVTAGGADVSGKTDAGSAYVFTYNAGSWTQTQVLTATPGDTEHNFGTSASISGDTIVIGEHLGGPLNAGTVDNPGAAYVFRFTGSWTQEARLTAFDGGAGDQFGISVSNSGDTAVICAPFNNAGGFSDSGAAYVFTRSGSTWTPQSKLSASDADTNENFGRSVAVKNNTIAVGVPGKFGAGAVYIFNRAGLAWNESAVFIPFEGTDGLGESVALGADLIAIAGAPGDTGGKGAAFIFDANVGAAPDSDGDGLSDSDEAILGTNPNNPDTDGDGLWDGVEVSLAAGGNCPSPLDSDSDDDGLSDGYENDFGPNMCDCDSDGDGLSDGAEVNTHHTNPTLTDSDGDGLSDFTEINMATDPNNRHSDGDTLEDGMEVAIGTNPLESDTDHDGLSDSQEVALAMGGPCPNPLVADSDGDGLSDGFEHTAGLNLCDADSDHDGLCDSVEVNIVHTDPLNCDTDGDGLLDGYEVSLAAGSGCPDPLDNDSDNDGIFDGDELTAGLLPCGADSDHDGLSDSQEPVFGTNPLIADTDGDGLFDGTEVDIAGGTGCPNPLVADSDGDTLADGYESDHDINPCSSDTDGDGIADNIDPTPRDPGVPPAFLVAMANSLADLVRAMDPTLFLGPNNNDKKSRQKDIAKKLDDAAKELSHNHFNPALHKLTDVAKRIDGLAPPPDWMGNTPQRAALHAELLELMTLVDLLAP